LNSRKYSAESVGETLDKLCLDFDLKMCPKFSQLEAAQQCLFLMKSNNEIVNINIEEEAKDEPVLS